MTNEQRPLDQDLECIRPLSRRLADATSKETLPLWPAATPGSAWKPGRDLRVLPTTLRGLNAWSRPHFDSSTTRACTRSFTNAFAINT